MSRRRRERRRSRSKQRGAVTHASEELILVPTGIRYRVVSVLRHLGPVVVAAGWGALIVTWSGSNQLPVGVAGGIAGLFTLMLRDRLTIALGSRTALGAVGLLWSGLLVILGLVAGTTDIATLATWALAGLLLPLAFVVLALPPRLAWYVVQAGWTRLSLTNLFMTGSRGLGHSTGRELYAQPWRSDPWWWATLAGVAMGLGLGLLLGSLVASVIVSVGPAGAAVRLIYRDRNVDR